MFHLIAQAAKLAVLTICVAVVLSVIFMFVVFVLRYKKCPSDKIMVIYGRVGKDLNGNPRRVICVHGGARFIYPLVQAYAFLDLHPYNIEMNLNAWLNDETQIDISARLSVAISTQEDVMQNAAERLLGLDKEQIKQLAEDIILGQIRLTASKTERESILKIRHKDKFLESLARNIETEISKIGLRLINLNIIDLKTNDN